MLGIQLEFWPFPQEGMETMSLVSLLPLFPVESPRRAVRHHHLHGAQSSSISARANKPDNRNSSFPGSFSWKTHSLA